MTSSICVLYSAKDFNEVTAAEFESIMRRSAVIKIFARFFDRQYLLAHLPDHEQYGSFMSKQDDMPNQNYVVLIQSCEHVRRMVWDDHVSFIMVYGL